MAGRRKCRSDQVDAMNYSEALQIGPGIVRAAQQRGWLRLRTAAQEAVAAKALGMTRKQEILEIASSGLPFSISDVPGIDQRKFNHLCKLLVADGKLTVHRAGRSGPNGTPQTYIQNETVA